MGITAEQLLVELDARTASFDTRMTAAEGKLRSFRSTATASGAAAGALGQRYANASLQIAQSAENIARTGKVAGEATRQVLSQGAQMAFMFGPTGAIAGAVAVTLLAVVSFFRRTAEEAKKTQEQIEQIANATIEAGARAAEERAAAVRANVEKLKAEIDAIEKKRDIAIGFGRGGLTGELAEKRKELAEQEALLGKATVQSAEAANKVQAEQFRLLTQLIDAGKANATQRAEAARIEASLRKELEQTGLTLRREVEIRTLLGQLEKRKPTKVDTSDLDAVNKKLDEIAKGRADVQRQLGDATVAATKTLVDDMLLELQRLENALRESGATEDQIKLITAPRKAAIALRVELETLTNKTLPALSSAVARGLDQLNGPAVFIENPFDFSEIVNEAEAATRAATEFGRKIEQSGRGVLQIAEAFGLVDENSAQALQNVTQLAAAIPGALKGDFSSILSGFGALAALISGFGKDSAEAQRHKESLEVLQKIRDNTADLAGRDLTGGQFAEAAEIGRRTFIDVRGGGLRTIDNGRIRELTTAELIALKKAAEELNIPFSESEGFVRDFNAAIAAVDFEAFSNTFAGQRRALELDFDIQDIEGPREQLEKFLDLLTDPVEGAPGIFAPLKDFDLSTVEGVEGFTKKLREIYQQFKDGEFDPADFPGLDIDEIIESFGSIDAWIEAIGAEFDAAIAADIARRAKEQGDVDRELAFDDVTDPAAILKAKAQQFAEQFPEIFGSLLDGLDLTTQEGLDAFTQRLSDAKDLLKENAEALGLTDAEIEELLSAIFGLESGADAAAAAIKSLADTLSEEFSDIDLKGRIFGEDESVTTGKKLEAIGVSGDLSTQAGRDAVVEALRALASATSDTNMLQLIAGLIADVQQLGDAVGDAAGTGGGRTGERTAIANAATALTERTGNRMADYLATQLIVLRAIEENTRTALGGLPRAGLVPPQIPTISAQVSGGVNIALGGLDVHVRVVSATDDPDGLGGRIARSTLRSLAEQLGPEISAFLAREAFTQRRLAGDVSVTP